MIRLPTVRVSWGTLQSFATQCARVEVQPPEALVRGLQQFAVIDAQAREPEPSLLDLSEDEIEASIERLAIRSHSIASKGSGVGNAQAISQAKERLAAEVVRAVIPDLDRVVTDLQPRWDAAAAPLIDGVRVYGFTSETTAADVIDSSFEEIEAWRAARDAVLMLNSLAQFRQLVSSTFEVEPTPNTYRRVFRLRVVTESMLDYSACFAAGDVWSGDSTFYLGRSEHYGLRGSLDWFAMAAGGLRLNTPSEVARKVDLRYLAPYTATATASPEPQPTT